MKKRLLLIALVIMLSTTTVMQTEIKAEAAATGALTNYTAAKVLAALLALVGVVVEKSGIQLIWDEQGLNTDALINNMMIYDRYLGMQMKALLASGAAGITTLTLNRQLWTRFKEWARSYFGVNVGTDNIFGASDREIGVLEAGKALNVAYSYTLEGQIYTGSFDVVCGNDALVFLSWFQEDNSVYPWRYTLYFVPVDASIRPDRMSYQVLNDAGHVVKQIGGLSVPLVRFGGNPNWQFGMLSLTVVAYMMGLDTSSTVSEVTAKAAEYRQNGSLSQAEDVTASPVEGVAGDAATAAGEDVISYGNTVTEENDEMVINGGLTVALPAENDLETLLADLAGGVITYKEYVEALGLQAVNTKTQTIAEVQEAEQTITTNPIAGSYTVQLNDLFPFCIPFDLYEIIECFKADPVAPSADITIPTGYNGTEFTWNTYTVSLDAFSPVAAVVRVLEYVGFVMGLMFVTRKLIEG